MGSCENDTPDKALVLAREVVARMKEADDAHHTAKLLRAGEYDEITEVRLVRAGIEAALSQPQHGGLVEAVPDQIQRVMSSKWLDPECGESGCQSLVWKRGYEAARKAHDTLIELNPSNYTHDDVCEANDAAVEAILILADALGERHGKTEEWWAERRDALSNSPVVGEGDDLTDEQWSEAVARAPKPNGPMTEIAPTDTADRRDRE